MANCFRFSQCDGQTPCGRCTLQGSSNCIYEVPIRQTKGELRTELAKLRKRELQSREIINAFASDFCSRDILQQLRNQEDLEHISQGLKRFSTRKESLRGGLQDMSGMAANVPSSSTPLLGRVFEDWNKQSQTATNIRIQASRSRGQQIILGDEFSSQSPLDHHGPMYNDESWTTVTTDGELVEHLLALYFCWEYPICASVSKEHFMEDFRKGHARYCSSLLVNALLALACRWTDRPSVRRNTDDAATAGDRF
jgi:hypothetical protein